MAHSSSSGIGAIVSLVTGMWQFIFSQLPDFAVALMFELITWHAAVLPVLALQQQLSFNADTCRTYMQWEHA
jgi:hypothetical protein